MNQENVNKLVDWIKANRNYSVEQLKQAALQGGSSEEDFNAALSIVNTPTTILEYKSVGIRFFALMIDSIIFGFLFWLFAKIFSGIYFLNQLYSLAFFAYYVLMEWKLGGTLGKLITGMRVVKSSGEPLDLKDSLIRNIMRIVDFLPFFYLVGAISVWNSKTKQRLGDRLAKTVVVSKNSTK